MSTDLEYGTNGAWFGVNVPVITTVDAVGALQSLGHNYVLTKGSVNNLNKAVLASLVIHPDCLVFVQQAPTLSVQTADGVYTPGETVAFSDGFNVSISEIGTGIILTGVAGGGLGRQPIDVIQEGECGLRSINGLDTNVTLAGYQQTTTSGGTITIAFGTGQQNE